MRFVHTADWQLGMTRYFLNGEAQPRYSAARRDAVAGLGALAAETGAEFVVVAGDVFEHNQLAPRVVSQSLEAMRADRRSGLSAAGQPRSARRVVGVHQRAVHQPSARTTSPFSTGPACTRCGRAWRSSPRPGRRRRPPPTSSREVIDDLPADGTTRIVVGHGAVDIFVPDKDRPSLIRARGGGGRDRPRRGALCGVGRQALSHAGRRVGPDLVFRIARGHQLRRHRARPRPRARRRRRREPIRAGR